VSGAEVTKLKAKQRMLDDIRSGRAAYKILVMQAGDRLSRRDGDEAFGELKTIAKAGIALWFYADGTCFDYGTFELNTMAFLRAEVAAEFRRAISRKTSEAMITTELSSSFVR
jgi:DNA invertase Pin-like site-specific DNA recombinase